MTSRILIFIAALALAGMIGVHVALFYPDGAAAVWTAVNEVPWHQYGTQFGATLHAMQSWLAGTGASSWATLGDAQYAVRAVVWVAAAIAIAAGMSGVVIVVRKRARPTRAASRSIPRPARVLQLATGGASRTEIARRTGLSQDAVTMLLRVATTPGGRKLMPPAA